MKFIIDVTHPAHVHFFRHAIEAWREKGHDILLVSRDKDLTLPLLKEFGLEHRVLSRAKKGICGLAFELIEHESRLLRIALQFKPDAFLAIAGTFIAHVGFLTRTPVLVFYDTEKAYISNAITYPFASAVCTPDCYRKDLGPKHVRYPGYQELAYLHPNRFVPNPSVVAEAGLSLDEPYFIIRFVNWAAGHDINVRGFTRQGKIDLALGLARIGRVIITSEGPLPEPLSQFRLRVTPTKIHHLLNYCSLYIGEGATMASEVAMLGAPAIYVNPLTAGTLDEQDKKYGLVHCLTNEVQATRLALELAGDRGARDRYQAKRQAMLAEKADVTAWMIDFVEQYTRGARRHAAPHAPGRGCL